MAKKPPQYRDTHADSVLGRTVVEIRKRKQATGLGLMEGERQAKKLLKPGEVPGAKTENESGVRARSLYAESMSKTDTTMRTAMQDVRKEKFPPAPNHPDIRQALTEIRNKKKK